MPSENALHKSNPEVSIHIVFQSHIIQSLFGEWTPHEKAVEDYSTPRPQADARWVDRVSTIKDCARHTLILLLKDQLLGKRYASWSAA
jgi:hypothetical protein